MIIIKYPLLLGYCMTKRKDFFIRINGVRTHLIRCKVCGEIKEEKEFYFHKIKTKYRNKEYLVPHCKVCRSNYYFSDAGQKSHRQSMWKSYKINYKGNPISYSIYRELLEYQQHRCAICGIDDSFNRLSMDHDHKTGEVRGLICHGCNYHAVKMYEKFQYYHSEWHTNIIKTYLSDPPINHIPTSLKHGWKYEMGVFPSPSEDNEMEEVVIRSPMDIFEEEE